MKKILFLLKNYIIYFLRLIFTYINGGETCVVCGKTGLYYPLCKNCKKNYFSTENIHTQNRCSSCGRVLISTETKCLQCRETPILQNTDKVIPLFSYRLWNKELMFLWKQLGLRKLSDLFAECIAGALKQMGISVIVPVPPRPGKIKEKGWDQIAELTEILKYKYGFKVFPVLQRNSVKQQKKLNRESRLETIGKAYSLCEEKMQKFIEKNENIPEKVCIIDDVMTTGATIESCAGLLKQLGIKEVNGVTLFIVD